MRPEILIVGQGLAGTLLAWEFERAGIAFAITDGGQAPMATAAAAGIINPVTGRRLVKSWRIDTLLPAARTVFRELEEVLSVPLWRDMRVRRFFADDREREVFARKWSQGELAPYGGEVDESGFWIQGGARVDLPRLVAVARARWERDGRWVKGGDEPAGALVIDCTGAAVTRLVEFGFVPWEFSKGDILELAVDGLVPDVVLNRRHWVVPVGEGVAWVGATHQPGQQDADPNPVARATLEASARGLLGDRPFRVVGHRSGVRGNLPDKRPVAGRHPEKSGWGIVNALGSKGALWAPLLARQWVDHLTKGAPFDAEIDVGRFGRR